MMVLRRPNARPQRQCAFRLHESAVSEIGSPDWFTVGLNKTQFSKKMSFYAHGALVYFGCKKMAARCCRHVSPNRTPDWQGVPGAHFLTDQGGSFMCPRLEPISKFTNSSIRGGPSGVPEAHPQKNRFWKKTSFYLHGTLAFVFRFFLLGATDGMQKGLRVTFSRWRPAGLKRVLRQFSGNPKIRVLRQ